MHCDTMAVPQTGHSLSQLIWLKFQCMTLLYNQCLSSPCDIRLGHSLPHQAKIIYVVFYSPVHPYEQCACLSIKKTCDLPRYLVGLFAMLVSFSKCHMVACCILLHIFSLSFWNKQSLHQDYPATVGKTLPAVGNNSQDDVSLAIHFGTVLLTPFLCSLQMLLDLLDCYFAFLLVYGKGFLFGKGIC